MSKKTARVSLETALDELIETDNLFQLIDQPTHIRENSRQCIDLIITDLPNLFVDNGVHPSLDKHCHHNIISIFLQEESMGLLESRKRWNTVICFKH